MGGLKDAAFGDSLFDYQPEPHARLTDPNTSHAAARLLASAESDAARVLFALYRRRPLGFTDFESAVQTFGDQRAFDRWRKRRSDLAEHGYVESRMIGALASVPETRPSPSGRQALVWYITAKGIQWVEDHRE